MTSPLLCPLGKGIETDLPELPTEEGISITCASQWRLSALAASLPWFRKRRRRKDGSVPPILLLLQFLTCVPLLVYFYGMFVLSGNPSKIWSRAENVALYPMEIDPAAFQWKCMSRPPPPSSPLLWWGRPPPPPQLLGILLVGKADLYTVGAWLHRHHALFERLVAIDGTESPAVAQILFRYDNVFRVAEKDLNLTASQISDQTLRGPAMHFLGNPVGCWILISHPDEFWVLDPREVAARTSYRERWRTTWWWKLTPWGCCTGIDQRQTHNVIRLSVLTASPMESDYRGAVKTLEGVGKQLRKEASIPDSFHIMTISNWTHARNSTKNKHYEETRFVQWEDGMRWGTRHSLVVPEHMPNGERRDSQHDAFFVHFKLHDFSPGALLEKKRGRTHTQFANSKLRTGLHVQGDGWHGYFLDVSDPEEVERFPPLPLEEGIHDKCNKRWLRRQRLKCVLPWNAEASFS